MSRGRHLAENSKKALAARSTFDGVPRFKEREYETTIRDLQLGLAAEKANAKKNENRLAVANKTKSRLEMELKLTREELAEKVAHVGEMECRNAALAFELGQHKLLLLDAIHIPFLSFYLRRRRVKQKGKRPRNGPLWWMARLIRAKRIGGLKCELCGAVNVKIVGHHIIHRSAGGPDTPENCQLRCEACEQKWHNDTTLWQHLQRVFKGFKFLRFKRRAA